MAQLTRTTTGQYLHAAKHLQLETRGLPPPGPGEVQVAIRSTTLCGSDLHYYSNFRNGSITVREPLCLGHEAAGEVVAVGPGQSSSDPHLEIGDAVALEVGVPCALCDLCAVGRYNVCPGLRFRSSGSKFPHYQGTLQERVNHPVQWVHRLPAGVGYEVGALLEPLAVAIHAMRRAEQCTTPFIRDGCLIFGAGAVGLLTAVACRAAGVKNIIMADIHQGRLDFAKEKGFATVTYTVRPQRPSSAEEEMDIAMSTAHEISDLRWPDGTGVSKVSVVFECTGVASCVQASVYATKAGGSVVIAGLGTPNITLPISDATSREITLIPTWRYANAYSRAIEIAEASVSGSLLDGITIPDIRQIITHRHNGIKAVEHAFKTAGAASDEYGHLVVKTVINFP